VLSCGIAPAGDAFRDEAPVRDDPKEPSLDVATDPPRADSDGRPAESVPLFDECIWEVFAFGPLLTDEGSGLGC
jgi:hypothetical protein